MLCPPRVISVVLAGLCICLAGCDATISDGPNPDNPLQPPGQPVDRCDQAAPAVTVPLRRLTNTEYQNVLEQLFESPPQVAELLPVLADGAEYSTFARAQTLDPDDVDALIDVADQVAEALVPELPACGDDACVREYFASLGARALRRTAVDDVTLDRWVALARDARADDWTPSEAMALPVVALLQDPRFLFVLESRAGVPSWTLNGDERAQRLALTYWRELPSETLMAEAAAGTLDEPAGLAAAAQRVVADPRTRATFHAFIVEWLELSELSDIHEAPLRDALEHELHMLIDDAWEADDSVALLIGSTRAYVNPTLEAFYGLPAESSGPDDYRAVELPERLGVLTHPLVMAKGAHGMDSSPILRGRFLRERVLCSPIPTPPVGAAEMEPNLPEGATGRQKYEARIENSVCATCHVRLDPVGFAFEGFDGSGRYRSDVDESGNILDGGDATGDFNDHMEFGTMLIDSETVSVCMAEHWQRYALGRDEFPSACFDELGDAFMAGGRSMRNLFEVFPTTSVFAKRSTEVSP